MGGGEGIDPLAPRFRVTEFEQNHYRSACVHVHEDWSPPSLESTLTLSEPGGFFSDDPTKFWKPQARLNYIYMIFTVARQNSELNGMTEYLTFCWL